MNVAQSVLAGLAGALLLDRLNVPAGALIGAMAGAAVLNLFGGLAAPVHPGLRFAAYAVIGWVLGQQLKRDTLSLLRQAALPITVIVVSLLAAGALIAIWLRGLGFDAATAYLAASPGGIAQMAVLSTEIGATGPVVITAHLIRITTVIITAPIIVRLLSQS